MVVWEANCELKNVRIQWYEKSIINETIEINTSEILKPSNIDISHHVYKGIIGPLTSVGNYVYEIVHGQKKQIISSHSFQFFPSIPDGSKLTYPIQIVAFADNQFGSFVFDRLVRLASKQHSPNFIIHAGDVVQEFDNLQQWQTDFYDPLTSYNLAQHAPIIYAHGNHDFDPNKSNMYTTGAHWYSFTIANTRWIVLDSNIDDEKQDLWLSHELSSPETQNASFKIVVVHIPPFMEFWEPVAWHEKKEKHWGEFVRTRFVPLFRKYGVDLVISGHQHNYQRGQSDGTIYTIIGGAGGKLDFDRVEDWAFYNVVRKTHHYILMEIWSETIIWKALLKPVANWYTNIAGYRQLGLRYDDVIAEESTTVQEALRRVPREEYDQRTLRLRNAFQLSLRNEILPRDKWIKPVEDIRYLEPYVEQVAFEEAEREAFDAAKVVLKK
ncbi:7975_t:CDS:2 [Funneliformis geosporum]|uniref:Complex III subunit 7 n=1 Tax=Funneliformis geosporum TaxID=1117311 RepID=A0A9W4SNU1_9GLOM|nr:6872_t:CDS:2 [Funneliformis geosporum]CAI2177145.1 7975_t:CDS:2 [Funneliformis geosporum]